MNFSFRNKLVLVITLTVAVSVASVAFLVQANIRKSFERLEEERTNALVNQFSSEFDRRGQQIAQSIDAVANSEAALKIALSAAQAQPDLSPFVNEAQSLSPTKELDLLEILAQDGTIISSAHWPARFGYKESWITERGIIGGKPFLKREELPEGETLAIVAARALKVRDATIYIVGGERLDRKFLQSIVAPCGLRPLLYRYNDSAFSPDNFVSFSEPLSSGLIKRSSPPEQLAPAKIAPLIQKIRDTYHADPSAKVTQTIEWTDDPEDAETIHASVLVGRNNELLGALLVASPRREPIRLARHIRNVALGVGAGAILLGILLSSLIAARVTKPIEDLAAAAKEVAEGRWDTEVRASSNDEIGQLAEAFNRMTHELILQREQLVQSERVAAWRELARRLAHELKNPLFPLQITVENLLRARESSPEQFDEVFVESTATLLAELTNLKTIIGRFSDFSKMPAPQIQPVDINAILREVAQLFQAQFTRAGGPQIKSSMELARDLQLVPADPVLIRRVIENLVLNALDAMPNGGTLTFRTFAETEDRIALEISDTGAGLTPEECDRLFTPYYTTKQFGTGLGLAIVQSIVSDHGGRISVKSQKNIGTAFRVELAMQARTASAQA
ncbi:MAG: integral rane sensor signal transduction histidine kinase [Acidobacteriales bacterium]|nr:integral rane sensor signal transduction histidine kinase [Terriglobales bacterium]